MMLKGSSQALRFATKNSSDASTPLCSLVISGLHRKDFLLTHTLLQARAKTSISAEQRRSAGVALAVPVPADLYAARATYRFETSKTPLRVRMARGPLR